MQFSEPRVLVVSHNVFSASGNMGKTMMHMLAGISSGQPRTAVLSSGNPNTELLSALFPDHGQQCSARTVYTQGRISRVRGGRYRRVGLADRTDTGSLAKIYQFSRRRTPLIYFLRDLMWRLGKWNTPALLEWVQSFLPDVIFFAAGDYAFPYRIALRLLGAAAYPNRDVVRRRFLYRTAAARPLLRRMQCRRLVKLAEKIVRRSGTVVTISDMMQRDYARLFQTPAETVRISGKPNPYALPEESRSGIVYAGNLGINRITPLVSLGRALKEAAIAGFETIHVYSGEREPRHSSAAQGRKRSDILRAYSHAGG